jgi:3,4-dihydroxy 2-butanone 4-phosphate synthase/GTP cyclohydrolase II
MPLITIEQAIKDIRNGKMVILVDDEDRENEGDLCMAAEKVTPRRSISWPPTDGD